MEKNNTQTVLSSASADPAQLLTIRQAAEIMQCSTTTVRNRTREGSLKAVRMGPRMIRIRREDLDAILQPYGAGQAGQWAHLR
jgi:excisionase family DNA binding protein